MKKIGEVGRISVSVRLDPRLIEKLEYLAAKAEITRARLIENMLETSVQSLGTADKLGVLKVALLLRDMETTLKSWVESIVDEKDSIAEEWDLEDDSGEHPNELTWSELEKMVEAAASK